MVYFVSNYIKSFTFIFMVFSFFNAHAFDGKRSGFALSLGAGVSRMQAKFIENKSMNSYVSAFSFRFGYGLNEKFSLFFGKESHIYKYSGEDILNEISAVGIKLYFFQDFYFYIAGGIGGFMNEISPDISKATLGTGYYYGLGYEFIKHFSIEVGSSKMKVDQSDLVADNIISPYDQTSFHILFVVKIY